MKILHTKILKHITLLILFLISSTSMISQVKVVDQIVAVVGKNIILQSEIEAQFMQYRLQYGFQGSETTIKCQILEDLLLQKLLLNQAQVDSVEVTDMEVEQTMDRRLRYFVGQFGSEEKLEEFYNKSIIEIKEEMRDLVRDQLMVDRIQQDITADISITPSEVKEYYKTMPQDSIPRINSEVEIGQIVKTPPVSVEVKSAIRDEIENYRDRILGGESFKTLAILYSEDPGSAKKGGELGLTKRGELYPEFEAVAFKLKKGEVSDIVETKAGFHIIELIERKGDYINVRHILLRIQPSPLDLVKAKNYLDSIADIIDTDSISFAEAARKYSDDPTKINGGMVVNPMTGTTKFETDQLDPQLFFVIDKMEIGEISKPVLFETEEGRQAYRLLYLKSRTDPHVANLKDDYNAIMDWALSKKKNEAVDSWVNEKIKNTYVKINDEYLKCNFYNNWLINK